MSPINKKSLPKTLQGYGRVKQSSTVRRPNTATTKGTLGIPPRKADSIGIREGRGYVEGARTASRINDGHPKGG